MKSLEYLERPRDPLEVFIRRVGGDSPNVAAVYQDRLTRDWAVESYFRASPTDQGERVQKKWYDLESLSEPAVLSQAIESALMADLILVSIYAAEELPLNLYVWFAAWLPRRLARAGAMAVLVGESGPQDLHTVRTIDYLQAVARKANLEFMSQARARPPSPPTKESNRQIPFNYRHWGLNE